MRLSLHQVVEPQAEEPRHQLQFAVSPAVASRTQVGGDGFGWLVRNDTVRPDVEAQRRREAFLFSPLGSVAGARFSSDYDGEYVLLSMKALEATNLFVDPARSGRRW